jgi:hypothetical protein
MSDATEIRVEPGSLGSLHDLVRESPTPLAWLVDSEARPTADTLPALLVHAPGPAASLPVDAQGHPIKPLMGRLEEADQDAVLAAIERRRMPLRHIALTSLLVPCDTVLDLAPPDPKRFGWYAGAEWTARLFARHGGVLIPASRVRVEGGAAGSPVQVLRAARSAHWQRGETLRELHRSVTNRST